MIPPLANAPPLPLLPAVAQPPEKCQGDRTALLFAVKSGLEHLEWQVAVQGHELEVARGGRVRTLFLVGTL